MAGKNRKNKPLTVVPQHVAPLPKPVRRLEEWVPRWAIFVVLAFTFLLYYKAVFNGFNDMDDDTYILKNPFLHNFSLRGVWAIFTSFYVSNYHPFTTLTYLLEYRWFGSNPLPYHLVNVLLHVADTWLVYLLSLRLSGKKFTAIVVAILFAVHPMHVESVAWVSERKDVLYALFYLASLVCYLRYISAGFQKKDYVITLLLFVASLLSKSAAVTLPVLLVAIDIYKGRTVNAKALIEKIPFFILAVLFGILNILAQKAGGPMLFLFSSYGLINGLFLITSGIAAYFIFLIAPFHLSAMHYFPALSGGLMPFYYYLSLPLLIVAAWLVARPSPYRKEVVFGISFFLITISVMLQVVSVGNAYMAERYSYIAYIGLFYLVAQLVSSVSIKNIPAALGLLSLCIIACSAGTWKRIGVWRNSETLFTDIIDKNPGILDVNYIYMLRGNYRSSQGDIQGALADYTRAIEMNPSFHFEYAVYYSRGHIYDLMDDPKSALNDYYNCIVFNPGYAMGYNARGWDNFQAGNVKEAIADLSKAISLKHDYAEAYNNRGWVYFKAGDPDSALSDYNKAIALDSGSDLPFFNRAMIKGNKGDYNDAVEDYNHVIKMEPNNNNAFYMRGLTYINMKKNDLGCQDLKVAQMLGNGRAAEAIGQYCH